ncbi:Hypothetical protein BPA_0103600 [Borrelia parkeri SLO]|uniref:Uncharacterized protein n=1 Tax=Borrelia parkeri SLO TaxID=1313294 RepID=A0ABM5PJL2_BORPR|nr:hypothetical protein [Borrelia parkeri]AHH09421.1 Hypothetical protein BPA_0103600 [Borrelia parkeri SLO]UPA10662.1 hypothetical protein bpSLO_000507 [Borrelia parkeri]
MRYIFLFLIVANLNLFAFENFFYDFSVRANYAKYFNSRNTAFKINPQKYYISDNYYVEVSNSILGDYAYYSFFNRKNGASYILPGSYVIKVGRYGIEQIKIFFLNRADTFIRIKAGDVHSSADFYLINTFIYKDIKLPFKISDIATGSFLEIAKYISNFIDFELFRPRSLEAYDNISNIVDSLRAFLKVSPLIFEVHDGAMNELGEMVYIRTGEPQREPIGFNCSGFGKWVADSIYKAMTGKLLKIKDLKVKHIGIRGNSFTKYYEFSRDPFFGLDWTRNIAYKLKNVDANLDLSRVKELDVNNIGFLKYIENRGYEIDNLEFILYYLAVKEPGHMYFGSLNTTINGFPGKVFHKHVVVLFPFIDRESIFRVSLMEINDETSIKSLRGRYPNSYIHLVRAKVPKNISIVPIPKRINN